MQLMFVYDHPTNWSFVSVIEYFSISTGFTFAYLLTSKMDLDIFYTKKKKKKKKKKRVETTNRILIKIRTN